MGSSMTGRFQIYLNIFLYLALFAFRSALWSILAVAAVFSTAIDHGNPHLPDPGRDICHDALHHARQPAGADRQGCRRHRAGRAAGVRGIRKYPADKVAGESQGSFLARQYDLLRG